jgi:hypothetical protein
MCAASNTTAVRANRGTRRLAGTRFDARESRSILRPQRVDENINTDRAGPAGGGRGGSNSRLCFAAVSPTQGHLIQVALGGLKIVPRGMHVISRRPMKQIPAMPEPS